jgi:hypothetical protein
MATTLSLSYDLLVLTLSVAAVVVVWRAKKDQVQADLARLARWLLRPFS